MFPGEVRAATLDDLDGIVHCMTTCWREAYAGLVAQSYLEDPALDARRRARWLARLTGAAGRRALVAVVDGTVVGVATYGASRDEPGDPPLELMSLELMSLYVRATHYGTGMSDELLSRAIDTAPASLWVFADNARGRAFYARHGFRPDGRSKVDPDTGVLEIRLVRDAPSANGNDY